MMHPCVVLHHLAGIRCNKQSWIQRSEPFAAIPTPPLVEERSASGVAAVPLVLPKRSHDLVVERSSS